MADLKKEIKDLTEATIVNDEDLLLIQSNGFNKKITKATLLKELEANKTEILNTIGTEAMGTIADTLKGGIKELNEKVTENITQIGTIKNNNFCVVSTNSVQSVPPNTETPILLNQKELGDLELTENKVKIKEDGTYIINSVVTSMSSFNFLLRQFLTIQNTRFNFVNSSALNECTNVITRILNLKKDDIVIISTSQSNDNNSSINVNARLEIIKVRD